MARPDSSNPSSTPTTLTAVCNGLLEAGWLAALVLSPLLFDVYANQSFEPVKVRAVQALAWWMLLALLLRGFDAVRRQGRLRGDLADFSRATGIVLGLALFYGLAHVLATALSVAPEESLWGSYRRAQGLDTLGAYAVLFGTVLVALRTRAQFERLISTALTVSFVVALYGLIQYFQGDPLMWKASWQNADARVASMLGNPIFAGSFLILTMPLVLYRLLPALNRYDTAPGAARVSLKAISVWGVFVVAWGVHPLAGLLATGLAGTGAVWLAHRTGQPAPPLLRMGGYLLLGALQLVSLFHMQSRGPILALLVGLFFFSLLYALVQQQLKARRWLVGGGVAGLLLIGVNVLPVPAWVHEAPAVARMTELFRGHSAKERLLIWQGTAALLAEDPARALVGYGPETLPLVFPPYYDPGLGHYEGRGIIVDRAHNATLDLSVTSGLLGALAYLLLFGALFYAGLRRIGLLPDRFRQRIFVGLLLGGPLLLSVAVCWIDGSFRLAGLTGPLGLAGAVIGYVLWHVFRAEELDELTGSSWATVALLSVLMTHFVEAQVGIGTVSTHVYVWVVAAVFVVLERIDWEAAAAPEAPARTMGLVLSLILLTLCFDFALPALPLAGRLMLLWLAFFTGVFGWLVLPDQLAPSMAAPPVAGAHPSHRITVALIPFLLVAVFAALQWAVPDVALAGLDRPAVFYLAVLALVLGLGWTLRPSTHRSAGPASMRSVGVAALAVTVLAGGSYWQTTLPAARADIFFRQAREAHQSGRSLSNAIAHYREALDLAPGETTYHLYLAGALGEQALAAPDTTDRAALFQAALAANETARRLAPREPDHPANRARLLHHWARVTEDSLARTALYHEALAQHAAATVLSPNNVILWNEWGRTLALAGDFERAEAIYQHSRALDSTFSDTHRALGFLYGLKQQWDLAIVAYEHALRWGDQKPETFHLLGLAYLERNQVIRAGQTYLRCLRRHPGDGRSHRMLVRLYAQRQRCAEARRHATRALRLAPRDLALRAEINRLLGACTEPTALSF